MTPATKAQVVPKDQPHQAEPHTDFAQAMLSPRAIDQPSRLPHHHSPPKCGLAGLVIGVLK